MAKVKIATNEFLPDWQRGIEVEIEGERLKELLEKGSVELLETVELIEEPKEEIVVVEAKPKKKAKKASK